MASTVRISNVARKLDISISKIVNLLKERNCVISSNPNSKIDEKTIDILGDIFQESKLTREKIEELKQAYFSNKMNDNMNYVKTFNNLQEYKVIGKVEHELGGKSARIKIIAIFEKSNTPINLTEKEVEQFFPPKGYVFEPGFFHNYKFQINDIVCFYIEENDRAEIGKDKYRLNVNSSEIKNYGLNARKISGFRKNGLATDLSKVSVDGDTSDGKFFGITDKYIVGELRMKDGKIEPALHHRIKLWDIDQDKILNFDGGIKLHHSPDGEFMLLDCMNDTQLFEWFRGSMKRIDNEYVNMLDEKAKWRSEIPKLFSQIDKEKNEVDKVRLKRIEEKFELINLSILDLKVFVEKSISLRDAFNQAIEKHKNELKKGYENQLEDYQKKFEKQKAKIDEALLAIQIKKEEKESQIEAINTKIKSQSKTIESLNQNKARIIDDFKIIKEVLSNDDKSQKIYTNENSFVIESYDAEDEPVTFKLGKAKEQFLLDFKFQLHKNSIFPNFANKILNVLSIYKAVFVKDIRIGLSYAATTKNAFYIIQQIEPDWLHFSDFWNNGLGAIWQSAHNYPEKLHFLFLEDINMSSPECYARPLLDMITGIRKLIPFGKTPYPENLKIIATKISTENPEIGLPLNQQTFMGWGCVGYNGDIYKKSEKEFESFPGIYNKVTIQKFKPDDAEIEMIQSDVKSEFNSLFDV